MARNNNRQVRNNAARGRRQNNTVREPRAVITALEAYKAALAEIDRFLIEIREKKARSEAVDGFSNWAGTLNQRAEAALNHWCAQMDQHARGLVFQLQTKQNAIRYEGVEIEPRPVALNQNE